MEKIPINNPLNPLQISASLLSADFARLGEEIQAADPFVDMFHLDVMDGHFVPNITFGPALIGALRAWTKLPFDVHLMISPVDYLINRIAKAGANIITVHVESNPHIYRTLEEIKAHNCLAGIALNPGTPFNILKPLLSIVDVILVMTVNPGFSGQAFLPTQLKKIIDVRALINQTGRNIRLQVDGGISSLTAPLVIEAGADILVAGSAIYQGNSDQYENNVLRLRGKIL